MKRKSFKKWLMMVLVLATCVAFLISCATMGEKQKKGTAWGAGIGAAGGALAGLLAGKDSKSALWGAVIGAAAGGLAGNQIGAYMDRQQTEFEQELAQSEAAALKREGDAITISFKGDVYFDTGKAEIKPGMIPELNRVADVLVRYPQTWIEVGGHADPRGSNQANQALSQRRADAVSAALVQRGVNPDRIKSVGYGEIQTISRGNPDSYSLDRRVEITIEPMRQEPA